MCTFIDTYDGERLPGDQETPLAHARHFAYHLRNSGQSEFARAIDTLSERVRTLVLAGHDDAGPLMMLLTMAVNAADEADSLVDAIAASALLGALDRKLADVLDLPSVTDLISNGSDSHA